jgi:hypothetical protein
MFLNFVMFVFIIPTSLVAGFWTLFGIVVSFAALTADPSLKEVSPTAIWLLLVFGWFGISTLWKLYQYLLRDAIPEKPIQCWLGLMSGVAVSLTMIFTFGGIIVFRVCFLGWPIPAALIFSAMLLRITRKVDSRQQATISKP